MEENQLRNILTSISHMAMHGEIPVHAFSTLISSAKGELVAEHLHQRWLSDSNFAKIAAAIMENRNMTFCSQILSLALRDFKSRRKIRKRSRHIFRNYTRTLVELYPVYRQIDKCLSACLIEPIFRCLKMLVDDSPDDSDLRCIANLMIASGEQLNQLNSMECDYAMMKCRNWLTSNSILLEEITKLLLLNALDLWTYSWNLESFPDCLRQFYAKRERKQIECARQSPEIACKATMKKNSSSLNLNQKHHSSVLDVHLNNGNENDSNEERRTHLKISSNTNELLYFEKEESIV